MDAQNRTITATYYDETRPFVAGDDVIDPSVLEHEIRFWIKGGPFTDFEDKTIDLTVDPSDDGIPGHGTANPGGSHEYKWIQIYRYTIPDTFLNGEYTFRMRVYDSDQNKAGGDCGFAEWTVNFQGGNGGVQLIE